MFAVCCAVISTRHLVLPEAKEGVFLAPFGEETKSKKSHDEEEQSCHNKLDDILPVDSLTPNETDLFRSFRSYLAVINWKWELFAFYLGNVPQTHPLIIRKTSDKYHLTGILSNTCQHCLGYQKQGTTESHDSQVEA